MIASLLGTTGAAMLPVRPLIQANQNPRHSVHVFIFLVANIGGSLTPLGDPPLFLGFLQGIDFTWTLRAMFAPMLLCSAILLALFYIVDHRASRHNKVASQIGWHGKHGSKAAIISGAGGHCGGRAGKRLWQRSISLTLFHVSLPLEGIVRDLLLLLLAWLSWRTTPKRVRIENAFTWEPFRRLRCGSLGSF